MKNAFLEPSTINHLVEESILPKLAREKMAAINLKPVIGIHVIYELARAFLSPESFAKGKELFTFVRDLEPSYSPSSSDFLVQELASFRMGSAVLPFHKYINHAATRLEVSRLSMGYFDEKAKQFIQEKEIERKSYAQSMQEYINYVLELKKRNPAVVPHLRSFEEMINHFLPKIPSMINDMFKGRIDLHEAEQLSGRLNYLPVIRTILRANFYLMWICIKNKVVPASDKLDDYKEVIEASYCDVFISRDRQLIKSIPLINSHLEVLNYSNVFD